MTLSDKIKMYRKMVCLLPKAEQQSIILQINALEFDVREFIQKLKEDMIVPNKGDIVGFVINEFMKRINKLAGDKLK